MSKDERISRVLQTMDALRHDLHTFTDDIWLGIDHRDPQARQMGTHFIDVVNAKVDTFEQVMHDLATVIADYGEHGIPAVEPAGPDSECRPPMPRYSETALHAGRSRLNEGEPHFLGEDFTLTKPTSLLFMGVTHPVTRWKDLYLTVCSLLVERDHNLFMQYVSPGGSRVTRLPGRRPTFTHGRSTLRQPGEVGHGLFAECKFSSNALCDILALLLDAFDIRRNDLVVYVRRVEGHET